MSVVLVTGANKGIGYETARQLVAAGHTVYLGARDPQRGRAAARTSGARFVQLDVTDDGSARRALSRVDDEEGHLDVLVNNAGVSGGYEPLERVTGDGALVVFDTNVVGVVRVTQAALPLLRRSDNPVVVNVSSGLGSFWATTNPDRQESDGEFVVYSASKAAVSMLTLQYAKAVPEIKFNVVGPGFTATDFTAGIPGGRPVEKSAAVVARWASVGPDGPSGTFQEEGGRLPW